MILQGNPWHLVLVSLSNLQLDFSTCNTVSGSVHLSKKKKKQNKNVSRIPEKILVIN